MMDGCSSRCSSNCCRRRLFLHSPTAGGPASLMWLQLLSGLEGMEDHVSQVTVGLWMWTGDWIFVAEIGRDSSLSVEPVGLCERVTQLSQAGLQGDQARGEVGGHWRGDSGVGR